MAGEPCRARRADGRDLSDLRANDARAGRGGASNRGVRQNENAVATRDPPAQQCPFRDAYAQSRVPGWPTSEERAIDREIGGPCENNSFLSLLPATATEIDGSCTHRYQETIFLS